MSVVSLASRFQITIIRIWRDDARLQLVMNEPWGQWSRLPPHLVLYPLATTSRLILIIRVIRVGAAVFHYCRGLDLWTIRLDASQSCLERYLTTVSKTENVGIIHTRSSGDSLSLSVLQESCLKFDYVNETFTRIGQCLYLQTDSQPGTWASILCSLFKQTTLKNIESWNGSWRSWMIIADLLLHLCKWYSSPHTLANCWIDYECLRAQRKQ